MTSTVAADQNLSERRVRGLRIGSGGSGLRTMEHDVDLAALRIELQDKGLRRSELAPDPFEQFARWFDFAREVGVHEPEAVVVSSSGDGGMLSSRHVLLRGVDHGFVFFTNYRSQKGRELLAHPLAALCFPWNVLARQVRVAGRVETVSDAESDEYFASRPRDSQIGAWASFQSEVIDSRAVLEQRWKEAEERYAGVEVPRPPHWGGLRVVPEQIEFWQGRPSRLHDRFRYSRPASGDVDWHIERLSP